ncbi:MAG: hypothetical protein L0H09_02715, partial [Psychrobacter sp.]|nr:hypothetical protein [Psychrobacter sp.]
IIKTEKQSEDSSIFSDTRLPVRLDAANQTATNHAVKTIKTVSRIKERQASARGKLSEVTDMTKLME